MNNLGSVGASHILPLSYAHSVLANCDETLLLSLAQWGFEFRLKTSKTQTYGKNKAIYISIWHIPCCMQLIMDL